MWNQVFSWHPEYLQLHEAFWCSRWPLRHIWASEFQCGPEQGNLAWLHQKQDRTHLRSLPSQLYKVETRFAELLLRRWWFAVNTAGSGFPLQRWVLHSSLQTHVPVLSAAEVWHFFQPVFARQRQTSFSEEVAKFLIKTYYILADITICAALKSCTSLSSSLIFLTFSCCFSVNILSASFLACSASWAFFLSILSFSSFSCFW